MSNLVEPNNDGFVTHGLFIYFRLSFGLLGFSEFWYAGDKDYIRNQAYCMFKQRDPA